MPLALEIALCIVIAQVILAALVMRAGNAIDPDGRQSLFLADGSTEARKSRRPVSGVSA